MNGGIIKNEFEMNVLTDFKKITTFIFDIDGVLTDGDLLILPDGLHARKMNVKDGFGLQMAIKHDYKVIIISGGISDESKKRLEYLGLKDVHIGITDKVKFVENLLGSKKIGWDEILYMGDDLPDIGLLEKVGMPACPADAVNEVKGIVKYISPYNGGCGCVRDVIEKVLKINGEWKYESNVSSR